MATKSFCVCACVEMREINKLFGLNLFQMNPHECELYVATVVSTFFFFGFKNRTEEYTNIPKRTLRLLEYEHTSILSDVNGRIT